MLAGVPQWRLSADRKAIRREWRVRDFATALDFFQRVGQIAEGEDHHPDLHLTGYRNVAIELSKVTWPKRETVTNGTIVVIAAGVFATVYVGLLDRLWGFVTMLVYGA